MKKIFNIIKNILVGAVVAIAVFMMIFTVISVNTFNRTDREIMGYSAFVVMSDSMSKTDFNAGDVIFVKNVDPATLEAGDIIAFQSQNSANYGEVVTHKIRKRITMGDGEQAFVTYGTTTDVDDESAVTYPYILGKYQGRLPKIGTFFQFLKTTQGYIVCILVPFALLMLYQGLNCFRLFKKYKSEQMEELQAERAQIEEERKAAAEMLKELQMLKEQLGAAGTQKPQAEKKTENTDNERKMEESGVVTEGQTPDARTQVQTTDAIAEVPEESKSQDGKESGSQVDNKDV